MRVEKIRDRVRRPNGWSAAVAACLALTQVACESAGDADARPVDEATPATSAAQGGAPLQIEVDPSALPTTPLEREAFVDDACTFAGAEQISSFFAFHGGEATVEGDDGFYAGSECAYTMQNPEVFLEVQFAQLLASSTEEVELAGVAGVRRNASGSSLENRARVQIPFRIEGSPVEVVTIQFHIRGAPPADEGALGAAVDALGMNLIQRMGASEFVR